MKIVTIIETKQQFINAATVSRYLQNDKFKGEICEITVHTGSPSTNNLPSDFFKELQIPLPNYNLEAHSASQGEHTAQVLDKLEDILIDEKPDVLLVYGEANSTLAGALAATKLRIPVAHVDAGLRSYNREMSEEINRVITDKLSTLLFCQTEEAVKNLEKEGIVDSTTNDTNNQLRHTNNNSDEIKKQHSEYELEHAYFVKNVTKVMHNSFNNDNVSKNIANLLYEFLTSN